MLARIIKPLHASAMAYDEKMAARVRKTLSAQRAVTEKRMVGGLSFLVNGAMCCGVVGESLMIRVGAQARDAMLTKPHTRPLVFGGRKLGGFICVKPAGCRTDRALENWVQHGLNFVAELAAKAPLARKAPPRKPKKRLKPRG